MQLTSPEFDAAELEMVRRCLDSRWVTQGPLTEEFERLFGARHKVDHAVATTSCTAALHLATSALGLGPGDEVIVPAFTWVTSAHCAEYVGAKAVFVDIDKATYNLDPRKVAAAVTSRTRAIVAVHLFGLACEMDEILALAKEHALALIEDAACAIGTNYRGRPVGAIGDIGCFSFHPRKVITMGEGGIVTTNRDDLAAAVRSLRNHGATGVPASEEPVGPWTMASFDRIGFNLRLSDIQAAVGVAQMAKLDTLLQERRRLALAYSQSLAGVEELALPTTGIDTSGHTFQSYVLRVSKGGRERRNSVMAALAAKGIQTRPGTHAVHRLGYYRSKYGIRPDDFPIASLCEDTSITLPIFPGMTERDQHLVVDSILGALTRA